MQPPSKQIFSVQSLWIDPYENEMNMNKIKKRNELPIIISYFRVRVGSAFRSADSKRIEALSFNYRIYTPGLKLNLLSE